MQRYFSFSILKKVIRHHGQRLWAGVCSLPPFHHESTAKAGPLSLNHTICQIFISLPCWKDKMFKNELSFDNSSESKFFIEHLHCARQQARNQSPSKFSKPPLNLPYPWQMAFKVSMHKTCSFDPFSKRISSPAESQIRLYNSGQKRIGVLIKKCIPSSPSQTPPDF